MWKAGQWIQFVGRNRPFYFNRDGQMDFLLDGKPHLLTEVSRSFLPERRLCKFAGVDNYLDHQPDGWSLKISDFIVVQQKDEFRVKFV